MTFELSTADNDDGAGCTMGWVWGGGFAAMVGVDNMNVASAGNMNGAMRGMHHFFQRMLI